MPRTKIVKLPAHIHSETPQITPPFDSCFVPRGFLFPESREDLQPYREFPLSDPFYSEPKQEDGRMDDFFAAERSDDMASSIGDSTILQISELDELLLDVQSMGTQYTLHTQMCLRHDFSYVFPHTWDKTHGLMTDIPVFSEELCQWHYPIATMGYNIANVEPPLDIDIARNYPQFFGYLPNGDLAVYWEIAELLSDEFGVEIDPIRSTVDGTLVLMPGVAEQIKMVAPCDCVVGTGIVVNPNRDIMPAVSYASQWLGRQPVVLNYSMYHYYRLRLPVIHCELDFNPYAEATWGAFGFRSDRLSGYEFKIVNNPFTREAPIFATERGNVVVSVAFYERLKQLVNYFGANFCARLFPIQRIP